MIFLTAKPILITLVKKNKKTPLSTFFPPHAM